MLLSVLIRFYGKKISVPEFLRSARSSFLLFPIKKENRQRLYNLLSIFILKLIFIFLFVFLSCDSEIYIIRSTAECQQLFNYFSKKFCRTFSHYKRVPPSTPLYYIYQMLQSSVNQNSTPSFTFCTPQALLWESMIAFTMERPMPLPP